MVWGAASCSPEVGNHIMKVQFIIEIVMILSSVCSNHQDGCTPLMAAVKNQNWEMAELLMKHQAEVSAADNVGGVYDC